MTEAQTCCICKAQWTINQPVHDYNAWIPLPWQDHVDSSECLACHNSARHRLMFLLEEQGAFDYTNKRILFFSPHTPYETQLLARLSVRNDCDISDPEDKTKNSWDIQHLPCQDNVYDAIFCVHVLEHIDNDKQALSELHRILKPNGTLVIGVPGGPQNFTLCDPSHNTPELRHKHYWFHEHKRLYGTNFVDAMLKAFNTKTCSGSDNKVFAHNQRIPWTEAIHFARKR
jgi:SAM-dependent methyltransferase